MKKVNYKPNHWKDKTSFTEGSIIYANNMNNIEKGITDVSKAVNELLENPIPGPQGEIGPEGPRGEEGLSAYELAVIEGFPGSLEDWLETIKGEKGEPGVQGPKGEKGDTGERGPRGDRGDIGPQGDRGDRGDQGPKGDRGEVGPQGPRGERGETGIQGLQGRRGEQGPQGERGPQGIAGPQGEKGERGERGPKGDIGEPGPQGLPGRDGITPDMTEYNNRLDTINSQLDETVIFDVINDENTEIPPLTGSYDDSKIREDIETISGHLDKITSSAMVNVKMFRCDDGEYVKGDGIHDDTTGMQKAHDTGKLVEYPKGIYKFSKLNFKKGGIVGHGKNETVLSTFDTSNDDIIAINPTLSNDILDTVLFKNFYLKGVTDIDNYGDKKDGAGIKVGSETNTDQSYFPVFDNVHIRYIPTCIRMINTTTFNVVNCDFFFYKIKAIDYSNDLSPDAGDCGILNNHFFNGSSLKTGIAIYQTNAGGLRITNNKFNGGSNAYKCEINDITSDLILIGNSIENVSDYGLRFSNNTNSPSKNTTFGNIVISGNQFALNGNDIIFEEISNYKDSSYWDCISITGNTFRHYSNGNCITLNTARSFIISSNAFFTASSGIVINSSCNIGEIGLNTFAYMDKETEIVNNGTNVNILVFSKTTEPTWNEIVLNNGFSYIGTNKPSYRVVNSTVEFRGTIVSNEPGVSKTMFTLPSDLAEKFIPNLCFDITSPFSSTTVTYSNKSNYARGEFNWKSTGTGNTFNLDIIKAQLQYI